VEKDLLRLLNGEINVARFDGLIRREIMPNGVIHLIVSNYSESEEEMLLCEEYRKPGREKNKGSPKHTGGKKPYIMLMTDEIEELKKKGVKNIEELIGVLGSLGQHVEWNTGKLIHKRSKKPLQYKDLSTIFTYGNKKMNRILNDLKEHDLLYKSTEGYFVSGRIIKKGKKKGADRDGL